MKSIRNKKVYVIDMQVQQSHQSHEAGGPEPHIYLVIVKGFGTLTQVVGRVQAGTGMGTDSCIATYKTSPRTSKTDRNWWRYGPNSWKYCLAHISVISGPFWLFLGSKISRVAGKGTGWKKNPQGYPQQSLHLLIDCF